MPAANLAHLADQQANASRSRLHQAPIAGLDGIRVMRECVSEKALVHSRCGNVEAEFIGDANQACRGKNGVRRIGSAPEADAIAGFDFADAGTERLDHTYSLAAHKRRKFAAAVAIVKRLPDEFAPSLLYVEEIDACGVNADERLTCPGHGRRQLLEPHHFRPAVFVNANRFHFLPQGFTQSNTNAPSGCARRTPFMPLHPSRASNRA